MQEWKIDPFPVDWDPYGKRYYSESIWITARRYENLDIAAIRYDLNKPTEEDEVPLVAKEIGANRTIKQSLNSWFYLYILAGAQLIKVYHEEIGVDDPRGALLTLLVP